MDCLAWVILRERLYSTTITMCTLFRINCHGTMLIGTKFDETEKYRKLHDNLSKTKKQ